MEGGDELIDVAMVVVKAERGSGGGGDAIAGHKGLSAMMAGADCDAVAVGEGCDIMSVDVFDSKGHDGRFVGCIADEAEVGDFE